MCFDNVATVKTNRIQCCNDTFPGPPTKPFLSTQHNDQFTTFIWKFIYFTVAIIYIMCSFTLNTVSDDVSFFNVHIKVI
jgi:hypothetical protein